MKTRFLMLSLLLAPALLAEEYVLGQSDRESNPQVDSFESAGYWVLASDGRTAATEAPSAGNTYTVLAGKVLQTINDDSTSRTFGGDRLTVEGDFVVRYPNGKSLTVGDLVVRDGKIRTRNAGVTVTLCGALSVPEGRSCTMHHWDNNGYTCGLNISSDISGAGVIRTLGRANGTRNFGFSGDNSGFTGKLNFFGKSMLTFSSSGSMFGAPAAATADWMTLNGCTLVLSEDCDVGVNGGVVIGDETDADRIAETVVRIQVADGKTAVFGPLSGAGTLVKQGAGKLVFAGGDADFAGELVVEAGEVEFGASGAVESLRLKEGRRYVASQAVPLSAQTLCLEGGLLAVDMDGYDAAQAVPVTVGALSTDNTRVIVDCRNYAALPTGTAYAILSGPADVVRPAYEKGIFAACDILGYAFSVTDEEGGMSTLRMTPLERRPEWIMSATDTDNAKNSFTTKGSWVKADDPSVAATEPPQAGNVYIVPSEMTIRTPDSDGQDHAFGGDTLLLRGCLFNKITDNKTLTVRDLIVEGGSIQHHLGGRNASIVGGTVTVPGGYDWTIKCYEGSGGRNNWSIGSDMYGAGTIRVRGYQSTLYRNVNFSGDNSRFTGAFDLFGHASVYFQKAESMPTAPLLPMADWMRLSGCVVVFQADATFAANGGLFIANETDSTRIVAGEEGGRIEVAKGKTVTFNGPLSGPGTLTKLGEGTLVLAGGMSGFTGQIVVSAGKIECAGLAGEVETLTVGAGQEVRFDAQHALLATNLVFAGGSLAFDLDGFDAANPVMLEAQSIVLSADGIGITCRSLAGLVAGQSYAILKGPSETIEAAVRCGIFYPAEPDLYSFESVGNGDGTASVAVIPGPQLHKVFSNMSSGHYSTAAIWGLTSGNLEAMTMGRAYADIGYTLRVETTDPMPGDSLLLKNASVAFKKSNADIDFGKVTVQGLNIGFAIGGTIRPAGDFQLLPGGANGWAMYCNGLNNGRPLTLSANLSGSGRLELIGSIPPRTDGNPTLYALTGDNADYVGQILVSGQTNFYCAISSETSLGGDPPVFRADQVSFNGGGLYATESLTLDDANRGLFTSGAGGICQCNNENGAYFDRPKGGVTVTNTILERTFIGALSLSTATAETLLRIDCPITGDGAVRVISPGTVALGGANTYAGGTELVCGTLAVHSKSALGTGAVAVRAGCLAVAEDGEAMPYGVELSGPLSFEDGASVTVFPESPLKGARVIPLFLLAPGEMVDPASVPLVRRAVRGYQATVAVRTVTVGGENRQLVEAKLVRSGLMVIIR